MDWDCLIKFALFYSLLFFFLISMDAIFYGSFRSGNLVGVIIFFYLFCLLFDFFFKASLMPMFLKSRILNLDLIRRNEVP